MSHPTYFFLNLWTRPPLKESQRVNSRIPLILSSMLPLGLFIQFNLYPDKTWLYVSNRPTTAQTPLQSHELSHINNCLQIFIDNHKLEFCFFPLSTIVGSENEQKFKALLLYYYDILSCYYSHMYTVYTLHLCNIIIWHIHIKLIVSSYYGCGNHQISFASRKTWDLNDL